ncbi:hypothetical protein KSP40_PGU009157 [Platanthera guangdongensis]|uniref:Uncharacterized protein n=1 Tax=Platanthera guangdongensis TaxID=2320717 RepID=A0ABR2MFL4_9ASPA
MAKRVEVTSDAWGDSLPLLIGSGDVQRRKKNKKQSEGSMVWMALVSRKDRRSISVCRKLQARFGRGDISTRGATVRELSRFNRVGNNEETSTRMRPKKIDGVSKPRSQNHRWSDPLNYTKCINSLENLLDAKVYSVDDNEELESIIASPDVKLYFYGPVDHSESTFLSSCCKKLDALKHQYSCMLRKRFGDSIEQLKKIKSLWKIHDNLIFCLENIGLYGAIKAVKILSNSEESQLSGSKKAESDNYDCVVHNFLDKVASVLSFNICDDGSSSDSLSVDTLEEPFCSQKLSLLIGILSTYRLKENTKCIIFVKRIIVARALACILRSLKSLEFWKCDFLVGFHSGLKNMSRRKMNAIVEKFSSGKVNLLVATNVAEEGLDIQTCCLVIRFDLPETVASFIQSRGRARMQKSDFVFLLERGNELDEKLLGDFMSGEHVMNNEIICRSSDATFENLDEAIYKVDHTGASISTACSISLLHRYCSKLPQDKYFTPTPKFFYIKDRDGTICRLILPPNAPFRQVDSLPCASKDEAKRVSCLKACKELHERGSLSDFLLPGFSNAKSNGSVIHSVESINSEDENLRELYEMLVPTVLKGPLPNFEEKIKLYFYYVRFIPIPDDRKYRAFGLFLKAPLPKEAEAVEVDLHLARGRIVKSGFIYCGMVTFGKEEIFLAVNFQEMFLKIILDRSEYFDDTIVLGKNDISLSSTFYILLPVMEQRYGENRTIDWTTVKRCLSSPAFVQRASYERCLKDKYTNDPGRKLRKGTKDVISLYRRRRQKSRNRPHKHIPSRDLASGTEQKSELQAGERQVGAERERGGMEGEGQTGGGLEAESGGELEGPDGRRDAKGVAGLTSAAGTRLGFYSL